MNLNNEKKQFIDLYNSVLKTQLLHSEQFVPWSIDNMEGVYRKLIFTRNSLLGEVSQYCSEDYILWRYNYPDDYQNIQKKWKGNLSTFLTRFIFLHHSLPFSCKRKAIWLGFRGYVDLIICTFPPLKQDLNRKEIRDIAPLLIENLNQYTFKLEFQDKNQ